MSIVIPPKNSGVEPVVPRASTSFNGTSLGSKPKTEDMIASTYNPIMEQVSQRHRQHSMGSNTGNSETNIDTVNNSNLNEGSTSSYPINKQKNFGHTTSEVISNSPNDVLTSKNDDIRGVNFNITGQGASISVTQNTDIGENRKSKEYPFSSMKLKNESVVSFKALLELDNLNSADEALEKLEYALKVAKAKKLLLEVEEKVKVGLLS